MLNFKKQGGGKQSIVFIHGNSQSLRCWDAVLSYEPLYANYSLVALDLPGHGQSFRSDVPGYDYSLMGHADHVSRFLNANIKTEYILVGNSFGTNIIGEIAPDLPGCAGIVLIGSALVGMGLSIPDVVQPNANAGICFTADFTEEQLALLTDDEGYNLPEKIKARIKEDFRNTDPLVRTSLAACVAKNEISDELLNIKQASLPVAAIYGKYEKICYLDPLTKIEFPVWKQEITLIENSGHCCQLDQPEALAEIILEFSNEVFKK